MNNEARILITGDFCPINRISDMISEEKYDDIFNDLLPYIKASDLAITNLECPLTDYVNSINKTGPSLKASEKAAKALAFAGFNLVTLANNHIMDFGLSGLESTIRTCKENNIEYVGAGNDNSIARGIFYTIIGTYTIAVLNFAENEFSTTHGEYPGANPLDLIDNYLDIIEAKTKADFVVVIVHGGHEMYDLPSPRIKRTFRFFVDAGANAVFGHHTHCYSGYEMYKGHPIFYGLGNFVFDSKGQRNSIWNTGFAVELILKDEVKFNIIPYEQCKQIAGVRLLPSQQTGSFSKNFDRLNYLISDDRLLNIEFEKYCNRVKKLYLSFIEPHSILLLHFLRNRRLFPSLLSKRVRALYLNLMRCESHRDVMGYILKKSLK